MITDEKERSAWLIKAQRQIASADVWRSDPTDAMHIEVLIGDINRMQKEIRGVIDMIPESLRVVVREGGGEEDILKSLAVSVAKVLARSQL